MTSSPPPVRIPNISHRNLPARDERDWVLSTELTDETGITYRQLDYWCRTGLLTPREDIHGSGWSRSFHVDQVRRARVLHALLARRHESRGLPPDHRRPPRPRHGHPRRSHPHPQRPGARRMTRQQKTPTQRAEEAVAAADRKVKRLAAADRKARDAADALSRELDEARQRLAYAKQDPALTTTPGDTA